jgi:antitoxin component HigA of HigAB toxin-antitoxin module
MEIWPIRTDEDHRAALAEIEAFRGAVAGTEEGDKLDVLLALVEIYEARRSPIDATPALIRSTLSTMPSMNSGTPRQNW